MDSVLELWERTLEAVATGDHSLIDRDIDWAIKKRLVDEIASRQGIGLNHPKLEQVDMAYHDVSPDRGLFHLLQRRGRATDVTRPEQVRQAMVTPPPTRAALRGEFLSAARAFGAEAQTDWVHHKLVDRPLEAIMLKDPFASADVRVDALLDKLGDRERQLRRRSIDERDGTAASLALTDLYVRSETDEQAGLPAA